MKDPKTKELAWNELFYYRYMCSKFKVRRTLFLSGSMFGFKAKTF